MKHLTRSVIPDVIMLDPGSNPGCRHIEAPQNPIVSSKSSQDWYIS